MQIFKIFQLKGLKLLLGVLPLTLSLTQIANAQWKYPTENWETIGPPKGTLYIIGGAAVPANMQQFLKLAGGPNAPIVVITTAGDVTDEKNTGYQLLVNEGAKNLTILHTKDRNIADSEDFIKPLKKAKAVMITGGFQVRLAKAYLHTKTHKALFDLLARGGVVAGSSAGASIQGSYLYGGAGEKEGFGFIKDSAIGQHYVRRNRMGSVAKILKVDPNLIGFGIDEATAIIVKGNDVIGDGDSKTAIYDPKKSDFDKPNTQEYLFPGDKYDLKTREITYRTTPTPNDLWANANKSWVYASKNWPTRISPKGKIIIYGAEKTSPEMVKDFYNTADTKHIVLLSTGNSQKRKQTDTVANLLKQMGAKNVSILHTIDKNEANSVSFAKVLKTATAILLCDGEKWQFANNYINSLVHKELFDVLKRNGTIASSFYAAPVLTSRLYGENFWSRGLALIPNSLLFSTSISAKNKKALNDILTKDAKLLAIGLNKENTLTFENGLLTVTGVGEVTLQTSDISTTKTIASGNKDTL